MISLQRILWLKHWNLTDLTYTVTPGACWSVLEPTLGVVNICLPAIRPVSCKVFNNDVLAWSKANRRNSTLDRLWKLNRTGPFSYPNESHDNNLLRLKDLGTLPTKPQISEDHPVIADYRMRSDVVNIDHISILVTKTWGIENERDGGDHVQIERIRPSNYHLYQTVIYNIHTSMDAVVHSPIFCPASIIIDRSK